MPSRRDQIQSYQFLIQRIISALVMREPDAQQSPFRRLGGAVFAGVMIAVLVTAGAGIFGLVKPGGKKTWKTENTVVLEKETGAVYVYRGGALQPVLNYASARLIAGKPNSPVSVSRASLAGERRGVQLGIPGAPDALPDPKRLVGPAWTLCSAPGVDQSGSTVRQTVLVVGSPSRGGGPLGDRGLVVTDLDSAEVYLVWKDRRYLIRDANVVLEALTLAQRPRLRVGAAWLNALPRGDDLGRIDIPGRGTQSAAVTGAVTGQVFVVATAGGDKQYYVALRDALAPVSFLQVSILLGDPATKVAYGGATPTPREFSAADASSARKSDVFQRQDGDAQPPADLPELVDVSQQTSACAAFRHARPLPTVFIEAAMPDAGSGAPTTSRTEEGTALADRVVVPPGRGAVVEAMPAADAERGALALVTSEGIRYAVPNRNVLEALGYGKVRPTRLPASLVARLPEGPALDPDAARRLAR